MITVVESGRGNTYLERPSSQHRFALGLYVLVLSVDAVQSLTSTKDFTKTPVFSGILEPLEVYSPVSRFIHDRVFLDRVVQPDPFPHLDNLARFAAQDFPLEFWGLGPPQVDPQRPD